MPPLLPSHAHLQNQAGHVKKAGEKLDQHMAARLQSQRSLRESKLHSPQSVGGSSPLSRSKSTFINPNPFKHVKPELVKSEKGKQRLTELQPDGTKAPRPTRKEHYFSSMVQSATQKMKLKHSQLKSHPDRSFLDPLHMKKLERSPSTPTDLGKAAIVRTALEQKRKNAEHPGMAVVMAHLLKQSRPPRASDTRGARRVYNKLSKVMELEQENHMHLGMGKDRLKKMVKQSRRNPGYGPWHIDNLWPLTYIGHLGHDMSGIRKKLGVLRSWRQKAAEELKSGNLNLFNAEQNRDHLSAKGYKAGPISTPEFEWPQPAPKSSITKKVHENHADEYWKVRTDGDYPPNFARQQPEMTYGMTPPPTEIWDQKWLTSTHIGDAMITKYNEWQRKHLPPSGGNHPR